MLKKMIFFINLKFKFQNKNSKFPRLKPNSVRNLLLNFDTVFLLVNLSDIARGFNHGVQYYQASYCVPVVETTDYG
jgi:hypothetical protein